ncbi:MAG: hypothetical protein U0174_28655 [Polyangiaceae bacterium]
MHDQELAIIRALVPIAWADGDFADKEQEMLDALLDAYNATPAEREDLKVYAKEKRTLEDINLMDLSAGDRRLLLGHAVILTFADGKLQAEEIAIIKDLAKYLRIPDEEAHAVIVAASERAKANLKLLEKA